MNFLNIPIILCGLFISSCSADVEVSLCNDIELGMTEAEVTTVLGKPYSETDVSDEGGKGLMYKREILPSLVVLTFKQSSSKKYILESCDDL